METQQCEPLAVGTSAPKFRLKVTPDQSLSMDECLGSPLVLIFYPADWSPVCSDELAVFNELLPELKELGAQVCGISVDAVWCHLAFAKDRRLRFPLLADFHPKGDVSRRYNAYRENEGFSERALYVIDREGKIFWAHISPLAVNPGADGVLEALEQLAAGGQQPQQSQTQEARP
jgi:peroxiredoxin